jgi:glycosyltransferase involved in cell wall biosynthesis
VQEKTDKPTVSIIIPTYNRGHLIGRAIQSVLNQTYSDFELIVVDDRSTDNTEKVVKSIKDKRIRYIQHEKNKGGAAARNTGIKAARGKYIAFQDSDDEWLSEKLEKQMKVFEGAPSNVGVVYSGFWKIEGNRKKYIPSSQVTQKEGNLHNEVLKGNFVTTQSIVMRKQCVEKAGMFDENLPRLQDWELVLRLSKYYEFKCIDEPLVFSYFTPVSISSNKDALIKASELIISKHFNDFVNNKKALSNHYLSVGISVCLNGDFKTGIDYFMKGAKAYPLNAELLVAALISFFGRNIYDKAMNAYLRIKGM